MTSIAQAIPLRAMAASSRERITGIDCGRFVAVIAVIFIHARTTRPESLAAESAARFAVPFFFMTAGFFLSHPGTALLGAAGRVCRRLLVPFLVWLAVYLLWFRPGLSEFRHPKYLALLLIRGGPANHLWFLPSLAFCSILLLGALRAGAGLRTLIAMAAGLYVIGLLLGAYYGPLTGRAHFPWDTRDGPFFGLPFMVAGYAIARTRLAVGPMTALALFLAGGAIQGAETWGLQAAGFDIMHDQMIGTTLFGAGFFLLARTWTETPLTLALARLGRYSLGIFVVHVLVLQMLTKLAGWGWFIDIGTDVGELAAVAVVATISTLLCVSLGKVKVLRPLVR
jgi:surface polysaccharide O-acyltransferase-like enzyme